MKEMVKILAVLFCVVFFVTNLGCSSNKAIVKKENSLAQKSSLTKAILKPKDQKKSEVYDISKPSKKTKTKKPIDIPAVLNHKISEENNPKKWAVVKRLGGLPDFVELDSLGNMSLEKWYYLKREGGSTILVIFLNGEYKSMWTLNPAALRGLKLAPSLEKK